MTDIHGSGIRVNTREVLRGTDGRVSTDETVRVNTNQTIDAANGEPIRSGHGNLQPADEFIRVGSREEIRISPSSETPAEQRVTPMDIRVGSRQAIDARDGAPVSEGVDSSENIRVGSRQSIDARDGSPISEGVDSPNEIRVGSRQSIDASDGSPR